MKDALGDARERILAAAEQIVVESGARHLTLAAVAARAKISRGGLLYHFPDKTAMLTGMVDRQRDRVREYSDKKRAELPDSPHRETIAELLGVLDEGLSVPAAFIAAAAHNPDLVTTPRENFRRIVTDIVNRGLSFERASIILLAAYGLILHETLSLSPFNKSERRKIVQGLVDLVQENTQPDSK